MSDLRFNLVGIDEDILEFFDEFSKQYWSVCKDEKTIENLVIGYKRVIILMIRYKNSDIRDILIKRGITDSGTQARINRHFVEHINSNIEPIIIPIFDKYGSYTLDDNVITFNFMEDFKIVDEYMAEVHAQALEETLYELSKTIEKQIDEDCKNLEELYKIIRSVKNDEEERDKQIAEYCKKSDSNLLEKYGAIIFTMDQFGFNSKNFKKMMKFFSENMSLGYNIVFEKYFKLTLRKDSKYKTNMNIARQFIARWEEKMKYLKDKEKSIRDMSEEAKRNEYNSWIN